MRFIQRSGNRSCHFQETAKIFKFQKLLRCQIEIINVIIVGLCSV